MVLCFFNNFFDVPHFWPLSHLKAPRLVGLNQVMGTQDVTPVGFNELSCVSIALTSIARVDGSEFNTSVRGLAELWLSAKWPIFSSLQENFSHQTDGTSFRSAEMGKICLVAFVFHQLFNAWRAEESRKQSITFGPSSIRSNFFNSVFTSDPTKTTGSRWKIS